MVPEILNNFECFTKSYKLLIINYNENLYDRISKEAFQKKIPNYIDEKIVHEVRNCFNCSKGFNTSLIFNPTFKLSFELAYKEANRAYFETRKIFFLSVGYHCLPKEICLLILKIFPTPFPCYEDFISQNFQLHDLRDLNFQLQIARQMKIENDDQSGYCSIL